MNKLQGIIYPRGFIRTTTDSGISRSAGDDDINKLYLLLVATSVNTAGWSYRRLVFPLAMMLFGNFIKFVQNQKENPFLYGYNYEFLTDTLQFIETGHRKVSVQNWIDLLTERSQPRDDYRVRPRLNLTTFIQVVGSDTPSIIAKWCSHHGGFEDMVMTLNIMFGIAKDPLVDNQQRLEAKSFM